MSELGMTREEREAFLAEVHVGVVAIAEEGRAPLTVPVWYAYEPGGEIRFVTGPNSRKGILLKKATRASLCVQTETAPYKYVSVEGPASVGPVKDFERDVRRIAHRYLGPEIGEMYLAGTAEDREKYGEVLVTIRPQRWYCVDYGKKAW
jgi:PPOX class probable F420-dependent enzyme